MFTLEEFRKIVINSPTWSSDDLELYKGISAVEKLRHLSTFITEIEINNRDQVPARPIVVKTVPRPDFDLLYVLHIRCLLLNGVEAAWNEFTQDEKTQLYETLKNLLGDPAKCLEMRKMIIHSIVLIFKKGQVDNEQLHDFHDFLNLCVPFMCSEQQENAFIVFLLHPNIFGTEQQKLEAFLRSCIQVVRNAESLDLKQMALDCLTSAVDRKARRSTSRDDVQLSDRLKTDCIRLFLEIMTNSMPEGKSFHWFLTKYVPKHSEKADYSQSAVVELGNPMYEYIQGRLVKDVSRRNLDLSLNLVLQNYYIPETERSSGFFLTRSGCLTRSANNCRTETSQDQSVNIMTVRGRHFRQQNTSYERRIYFQLVITVFDHIHKGDLGDVIVETLFNQLTRHLPIPDAEIVSSKIKVVHCILNLRQGNKEDLCGLGVCKQFCQNFLRDFSNHISPDIVELKELIQNICPDRKRRRSSSSSD